MLTREEAKRLSELYSAVAEGKAIQMRSLNTGKWVNVDVNKNDIFLKDCDYRIKPKPKYRPFKNQEECWNEMLKHQPFGWVVAKDSKIMYHVCVVGIGYVVIDSMSSIFSEAFADYEFTDGTPFGIEEE